MFPPKNSVRTYKVEKPFQIIIIIITYVRGKKEIKGKKARKYAEEQHDNNKSYRRKIFRIESNTSELGKN